jgi:hypothetical protein
MAKAVSGGGIRSDKVIHRSAPKAEPRARAVSPAGARQLGQAIGNIKGGILNPTEPLFQGKATTSPAGQAIT